MATIKDVATYAGLSVSAVSKYLRSPQSMRVDSRVKIERAIEALQYTPSTAARALRLGKSGLLSVVMPDITNPFFAELFTILRREAALQGYTILLQTLGESEQAPSIVSHPYAVASSQRVDGVIICFPDEEEWIGELVRQLGNIPLTLLGWRRMDVAHSSILLDVRGGIYQTTQHLLSLGHKRIAYIGGPSRSTISQEKHEGFVKALAEADLPALPEYVYHGRYSMETGYQSTKNLLAAAEPPTAIVAENDILAVGCIKCCHRLHIPIPEGMAISGFDDIPLAAMYEPPLTTARSPLAAIGRAAVTHIASSIAGEETVDVIFRTELIVRKSTDARAADSPL